MADHSQRAQKIIERGQEMENLIAGMLSDFEAGKINRRQLIQSLALAAVAFHRQETVGAQTGVGFKTLSLDHISYQVADYRRTRDFYADLMGMTVADDNGSSQCVLDFGDSRLIARNRRQREGEAAPPDPKPTVDHISYTIEDWDTDRVRGELERRGLNPRLDAGGSSPNYVSYHVADPDGFDLQISGIATPGDSRYTKP